MKITIQLVIALVLLGTSLVSLASVLVESLNYDLYYWQGSSGILDATSNNTQLISIRATRDLSSGGVLIETNVSATNPSGYKGFVLRGFDLTISFLHAGNIQQSIFWTPNNLLTNIVLDKSLGPEMTIHASLSLLLNSTQSSTYQMFNQTYGGDVQAHCVLITKVNSFLDPVYGVMAPLITRDMQVS